MIDGPPLRKRHPSNQYQVRFWADMDIYRRFAKKAKSEGYFIRDLFNDFMGWFLKQERK